MAKKGTLYVVHAGSKETGYHPIYETTKLKKAESYVHDLLKSEESAQYDKVYISHRPLSEQDKRSMWED